ncbi:MAG TPA: GerMN domain-containing protein [Acidimicrobiales bacterium]|nr:GerMN domain-containing protein [Acidimicrobiales bacterium]
MTDGRRRAAPTGWRRTLAVAALATTAAGCGVPLDNGPTALPRRGVPFGLLTPGTPTTSTSSQPPPVAVSVQVFLLAPGGHVAAVSRDVPVPAPLAAVLGALVDGPTNTEAAAGLSTAIPAQTQVISATVTGGTATVDLGGTFGQLVGPAQIDAVAQIVFTATALPGVTGVAFELSGQPVDVPTASGADVSTADRAQFASMAP